MISQLIITMRGGLARRFARDRSLLDVASLLGPIGSARLIGAPGFSMRVAVDADEEPTLRQRLGPDFIVDHDHVMESFADEAPKRQRGMRRAS